MLLFAEEDAAAVLNLAVIAEALLARFLLAREAVHEVVTKAGEWERARTAVFAEIEPPLDMRKHLAGANAEAEL